MICRRQSKRRSTFVCLHRLHYEVTVPGCDCEHCWLGESSCTHPEELWTL